MYWLDMGLSRHVRFGMLRIFERWKFGVVSAVEFARVQILSFGMSS